MIIIEFLNNKALYLNSERQEKQLLAGRYKSHAPDSSLLHLAHEAWNCLAKLELILRDEKMKFPEGGRYSKHPSDISR
ncbi:MAG: hypothetical protein FP814_08845 [Desulfobacterium sp.]|nr:hypothetical protein [Desulfobacterium sp.]